MVPAASDGPSAQSVHIEAIARAKVDILNVARSLGTTFAKTALLDATIGQGYNETGGVRADGCIGNDRLGRDVIYPKTRALRSVPLTFIRSFPRWRPRSS